MVAISRPPGRRHADRGIESIAIVFTPEGSGISRHGDRVAERAPNTSTRRVLLRDVTEADLPTFFEHQRDPDANEMAAFPPRDWNAFMAHWATILDDETVTKKTILFHGQVAGNVVSFERSGRREVGYWIGKEYWGKGVASQALSQLLSQTTARPLHAHVAKQNIASLRVLQKCGFRISGEAAAVSDPGGDQVEEFLLVLRT
jgi:RimJ/RimL family protein N-acetyltransferase